MAFYCKVYTILKVDEQENYDYRDNVTDFDFHLSTEIVLKTSCKMIQRDLTMVDLFAGTGGFSVAFHATGRFKTIYANDCEPCSKIIYEQNIPASLDCTDLLAVDISTHL